MHTQFSHEADIPQPVTSWGAQHSAPPVQGPQSAGQLAQLSPTPQAPSPQDPFPLPEQVHAELQVPTASPTHVASQAVVQQVESWAHTQPWQGSSPEHPGKLERSSNPYWVGTYRNPAGR